MMVAIRENILEKSLEMSKMFPYFVVPNHVRILESALYISDRIKAGFLFDDSSSEVLRGLATFNRRLASLYLYISNQIFDLKCQTTTKICNLPHAVRLLQRPLHVKKHYNHNLYCHRAAIARSRQNKALKHYSCIIAGSLSDNSTLVGLQFLAEFQRGLASLYLYIPDFSSYKCQELRRICNLPHAVHLLQRLLHVKKCHNYNLHYHRAAIARSRQNKALKHITSVYTCLPYEIWRSIEMVFSTPTTTHP